MHVNQLRMTLKDKGDREKKLEETVHWLPNRTIDTNLDWLKKQSLLVMHMILSILSGTII